MKKRNDNNKLAIQMLFAMIAGIAVLIAGVMMWLRGRKAR